ncbi:DNA primase small subunit [Nosema granulosis]|uniref:DNA primase small subunit n=1 Tax=Nosema granulosis TaxID=83296 RepID=A0A9P6H0I9_9MICR|nr:DNA primase small subunit [Nosema granulosis]
MDLDQKMMLFTYYKSFFPTKELSKWLQIDEFREISFCLSDGKYLRYLTFLDYEEFEEKLISFVPAKIDIGAVYDVIPEKNIHKQVVKRELVFDIDLTDYDRNCCKDKMVCKKCVVLIKVAVGLLDYSLRKELGFKNIGFVFSGRRGLHCWVNDPYTKTFTESERGDIVKFFNTCTEKSIFPEEYTKILMKYSDYMKEQNFEDVSTPFTTKDLYKKMFIKLDKDVTTSHIHLIKMPFCVHPSSGKLSVPIDVEKIDSFSVDDVPSLQDVINNPNILQPYITILKKWCSLK